MLKRQTIIGTYIRIYTAGKNIIFEFIHYYVGTKNIVVIGYSEQVVKAPK